jgi:hypothetical protein
MCVCVCVYVQLSLGDQQLHFDDFTPEEEATLNQFETKQQMFSAITEETSDFCADWGKDYPALLHGIARMIRN